VIRGRERPFFKSKGGYPMAFNIRNERIKARYHELRHAGYSSKDANRLKHLGVEKISADVKSNESIKNKSNLMTSIEFITKDPTKVEHKKMVKMYDSRGRVRYETPVKILDKYVSYKSRYSYIVEYKVKDEYAPRYFTVGTNRELSREEVYEMFKERYNYVTDERYKSEIVSYRIEVAFSR
jgi:hypothetical protein